MVSLLEVKNYIRATDEDDELVLSLMDAAEAYLQGAVDNYVEAYADGTQQWKAKADLCKKLLVADWYENRTPQEHPVSSAIKLLITQLQLDGVAK